MRRIPLRLMAILCLAPAPVWSQIEPEVLDLQSRTADLVSTIKDLKPRIEDLGGQVANLEVEESDTEVKIELSGDVLFNFDSAEIRKEAEPQLAQLADVIKQYPGASVHIEGYTDSKGSDDYNLALSQRRADSVRDWLASHGGIAATSVSTRGLGEANPVAPNEKPDGSDNPKGRQQNRRVEITVKKQ
jgi:outer membrane protein OmpA-like peptidoglycan-associated protein